jgi:hypothetical protein
VQQVKRASLIGVLALVVVGILGAHAITGYALPGNGTPCVTSGCHATAPAGDPSLNPPSTPDGAIPTTTVDATCAVTACNAVALYRGNATINLSADDNAGGWGVGYVYYQLDGGPVRLVRAAVDWTAGTGVMSCDATIPVAAPGTGSVKHTLKYWSQDNYGNVEGAHTATFTVAARTAMPMPIASSASSVYRRRALTISGSVAKPGISVVLWYKKPGSSTYKVLKTLTASSTGKWSYKLYPGYHGSYYFKATFAGDSEWLASSSSSKRVYVK